MVSFITTLVVVVGPIFLLAGTVALVMWPRAPRGHMMRGQIVKMGITPLTADHPRSSKFTRSGELYYCKVRVGDAYGTTLLEPWVYQALAVSNIVNVDVAGISGDCLSVRGISRI